MLLLTLVIGAAVGGILDFRAWHANAAFEATIPVLLAIGIALVAGTRWLVRRSPLAGVVAVAAVVFVVGFRIGAWIAPSANRGAGRRCGPSLGYERGGNTTYDIRIDCQAAAGRAELVEIPRAVDAPSEGGFPGVVPEAISGVLTWMCEAPRGELTPIEGSWFH